jgi:hypothetical protein
LGKLFGDCTSLHQVAYDYIARDQVVVDDVMMFWMGFPCKDVSSLCPSRATHRAAFADGDMSQAPKTGGVFKNGVLAYLRQHGSSMRVLILENVMGLAQCSGDVSPLDVCIAELRGLGLHCIVFKLQPNDFGFPQSRPRIWIIGIPVAVTNGMTPYALQELAMSVVVSCSGCAPTNLTMDCILLPDSHPSILQLQNDCKQLPFVTLENRWAKKPRLWPEAHLQHCKSVGKAWWSNSVPSRELQELFPTLRALVPREFDLLASKFNITFPERPRRIINVNPSISLAREDPGTVTPSMRSYLSDQCRLATGLEAMCLQGLHFGDRMTSLSDMPNCLLLDLAGNSFHAWVAATVLLVTQCLLGECSKCRAPSPYQGLSSHSAETKSESTSVADPSAAQPAGNLDFLFGECDLDMLMAFDAP